MARRFPQTTPTDGGTSDGPTVWSPDAPPETPHALDDEFGGGTITGWTELDNSSELTGSQSLGRMRLTKISGAIRDHAGFYRAVPAVSDYSITTKCMVNIEQSGTLLAGLFLAEDLGANPTTANILQFHISLSDNSVSTIARTAYDSGGTPSNLNTLYGRLMVYLRFRVSGTTVDVDLSWDGMAWEQIKSNIIHGLGAGIAHYGVFLDNRSGVTTTASFEFVRVTESSEFHQDLGGFV